MGDEHQGGHPAGAGEPASSYELTVSCDTPRYVLGRGVGVDLPIDDPRVSRRHLLVDRQPGAGWLVADAGSRNGTYHCDGRPLHRERFSGELHLLLGHPVEGVPVVLRVPTEPAEGSGLGEGTGLGAGTGVVAGTALVHGTGPAWDDAPRRRPQSIGRGAENDVVLEHPTVSLRHAEIRWDGDGMVVLDKGSRNGTFVGGEQVDTRRVVPGDRITCGARDLIVGADGLRAVDPHRTGGLHAEHVTVRARRGRTLLDNVSFTVRPGTLVGVIGPSGAGKSTLINAVTGFRPPSAGRVLLDGRDVSREYDELKDRIGLVPQDDVLHTALTVRQCLRYAAELRLPADTTGAQREARIDEVLRLLELRGRADVRIDRLSGGQRKRVNTAVELLTEPSLLILDEPTSGLDPHTERQVLAALRNLVTGGRIVVVVTHSMDVVRRCDEVVVIAEGRLAYQGEPEQAPAHFGTRGLVTVFERLGPGQAEEWTSRWRGERDQEVDEADDAEPVEMRTAQAAQRGPNREGRAQTPVLVRRYLRLLAADRLNLVILLAQAPLLGLLARLFNDGGGMLVADQPNPDVRKVLLILVLSITWLGTFNAAREIVKERSVFRRERAAGVSPASYVASKVLVLGALTLLQTVVLVSVTLAGRTWPGGLFVDVPGVELAVVLLCTGLTAMAVALLVSGLVNTSDKAVALAPLLVVPQLVLCGALLDVTKTPTLDVASRVVTARAGFSAAAGTVDLPSIERGSAMTASRGADEAPDEWRHDRGPWLANLATLGLLTAVAYVALLRALTPRRVRSRHGRADSTRPAD